MMGGSWTCVSIKLSRKPRLHVRLDFLQLRQQGRPSSHLRCRSRHVRQPVRTRFGLPAATAVSVMTASLLTSGTAIRL